MEDPEEPTTSVDKNMYEMVSSDIANVPGDEEAGIHDNQRNDNMTSKSFSRSLSRAVSIGTRARHEGSVLEWQGINYTIPAPDKSGDSKTLLHPMSGRAEPGQLMAVMGASGAGKSTLLDVLAGRLEAESLHGIVTINGQQIDKRSFRKESGYVMQSDALFPLLTVRETIKYAAYLRVGGDRTKAQKNELAEGIIDLLRLDGVADTIVGDDDNRGLSGGEKRRVSIAVDIVHFPALIFLDEPTSGLDSTTALSVVDSLKALAETLNCTVVMTIHQPSSRLFNLLDRVMFLAKGHVVYNGSTSELSSYTKSVYDKAALGDPPLGNPPEMFLDLCDILIDNNKLEVVSADYVCEESTRALDSDDKAKSSQYANNLFAETYILCERAVVNILRTKEMFLARLMIAIVNAILMGTLFLDTNQNNNGLKHRASFFVFTIAFFYFTSLEALPIFLAEREVFQREYSRGAYRAISYTLATQIVMLPFMLIIALIFVLVSWWLVNLPNLASVMFFHVLIVFTVLVAGNAFSTMVSVLVPNPMTGQTAGSALFAVMFLFSGNFINRDDIPDYWIWIHYLSLFKYAYESMLVNAFQNLVTTKSMTNEQILESYDIDGIDRGTGVGVLWIFVIFFRIVFYYRLTTAFSGSRK